MTTINSLIPDLMTSNVHYKVHYKINNNIINSFIISAKGDTYTHTIL